jgi:hypothetical protein
MSVTITAQVTGDLMGGLGTLFRNGDAVPQNNTSMVIGESILS